MSGSKLRGGDLRRARRRRAADACALADLPGARALAVGSAAEAARAVVEGRAAAAVHDAPILRHLAVGRLEGQLHVLPGTFQDQHYAFGLPTGSPLREPINRALRARIQHDAWRRILARYLGDD